MRIGNHKKTRRTLMLLDVLSITASVFLSTWIRFFRTLQLWQVQLYTTIYFLTILIYLVFGAFRRVKGEKVSFFDMGMGENLFCLIRERIPVYVVLIFILAMSQSFSKVSRLMLFMMGSMDIIFSYAGRMVLRHWARKSEHRIATNGHYLVVTVREQEQIAYRRLLERLPRNADFAGMCYVDAALSAKGLQTVLEEAFLNQKEKYAAQSEVSVFVYLRGTKYAQLTNAIAEYFRKRDIPVYVQLFAGEMEIPRSLVSEDGVYASARFQPLCNTGTVLGVHFTNTHIGAAVFSILDKLCREDTKKSLSGEYICFSNVHTTVMAHDLPEYRAVLNGSLYTFPDGMPIASALKSAGFETERVAGPDFMDAMFRATMDGTITHYFFGSTPETIEKLSQELPKRYPGIRIAGMVSPPFRPETKEEDEETIRRINESGADLIWIGLGAPKQENWMAEHKGKVNGLMLGVGAGFNFYAGTVKRAPRWIQKLGMEWLFRLFQDPKRLANRYIVTNAKFLWYMFRDNLKLS